MPSEFEPRIPDLFEREAFRLELLDEYDAPATRERVRRFLAGEPQNLKVRAYWDGLIADARRAGKNMSRVHVVTEPRWRGTWLRTVMITDPSFVADCCRWRDIALSNATPLSAYMTESEVP